MQPCFEQEKHQYHENRLEHFKESFLYEMLPAGSIVYIPDGGADIIWDSTTLEYHVLTCKSGILQLDWKGHSVLGIHLDEAYDYSYKEEGLKIFLENMHMLGSWAEKLVFCNRSLKQVIEKKSRHPVLLYGMKQMTAMSGCVTVEGIANDRGYSVRQLERLFKEYLHITPKQYGQYCRLLEGVEKMKHSDFESFRQLSVILGYSDTSHFQREFKRFFQVTPKEFKALYL